MAHVVARPDHKTMDDEQSNDYLVRGSQPAANRHLMGIEIDVRANFVKRHAP